MTEGKGGKQASTPAARARRAANLRLGLILLAVVLVFYIGCFFHSWIPG